MFKIVISLIMFLLINLLATFFTSYSRSEITLELTVGERRNFLYLARDRFVESRLPDRYVNKIDNAIKAWEIHPTENNWDYAINLVYKTASQWNIVSKVTIHTKPKDGAKIKYQSTGERVLGKDPITVNELTPCKVTLVIGEYYIWSIRDDRVTSNINDKFLILRPNETIIIQEMY